jgi:hypothetical protein
MKGSVRERVYDYSQVEQPVRALVELFLVCLILVSRANRCVPVRDALVPGALDEFESDVGEELANRSRPLV